MTRAVPGFAVAVLVSGALHAAGTVAFHSGPSVLVEGGQAASIALMGDAFEDLAAGAQAVVPDFADVPTTEPVGQPVAQTAVPVRAAQAAATAAPAAQAAPVSQAVAAQPDVATAPDPELAAVVAAPQAAPVAEVAPAAAPPAPVALPAATARAEAAVTPSAEPVPPARPESRAPVRPDTVVEAVPDQTPPPAVVNSPRPEPKPKAKAAKPAAAGNSDRNARRGDQAGQAAGRAEAAGQGQVATAAGNAARANYPGAVLRQIQRVRKQPVAARGTVVVAFQVRADGALGLARILRSSGSAVLEEAALAHIRRAAPFPAPPAGAQTAFTFEFVGRN
jgi:protein TonB